jgi:hypothetical protein
MPLVVLIALAVSGWFYAASAYQYRGYSWADQTCDAMASFCAEPHKVAIVAVAVVTMVLIIRAVRS